MHSDVPASLFLAKFPKSNSATNMSGDLASGLSTADERRYAITWRPEPPRVLSRAQIVEHRSTSALLSMLPPEISEMIYSLLDARSLKNMRLALPPWLWESSELILPRLFRCLAATMSQSWRFDVFCKNPLALLATELVLEPGRRNRSSPWSRLPRIPPATMTLATSAAYKITARITKLTLRTERWNEWLVDYDVFGFISPYEFQSLKHLVLDGIHQWAHIASFLLQLPKGLEVVHVRGCAPDMEALTRLLTFNSMTVTHVSLEDCSWGHYIWHAANMTVMRKFFNELLKECAGMQRLQFCGIDGELDDLASQVNPNWDQAGPDDLLRRTKRKISKRVGGMDCVSLMENRWEKLSILMSRSEEAQRKALEMGLYSS